jgi:hypothetical protein
MYAEYEVDFWALLTSAPDGDDWSSTCLKPFCPEKKLWCPQDK